MMITHSEIAARMQQQEPSFPGAGGGGGGGGGLGSHPLLGHVPDDSPLRATWQPASRGQAAMMAGSGDGMPWCVRLQGPLIVASLRAALLETVRNEEALRTLLRPGPTTQHAEQLVLGPDQAERCLQFLQHAAGSLEEALQVVAKARGHRFDLQHGPVVRADLVAVGAGAAAGWRKRGAGSGTDHHVLLVATAAPHADHWSAAEHRRQVLAAYAAAVAGEPSPLPRHSLTYLDYSLWQRRCMAQQARAAGEAQSAQQRAAEAADAPSLELPCDRPRPREPTHSSGAVDIRLPPNVLADWKALLAARGHPLSTGALALFHVLLSRWTGQEDVAIATVVANRGEHPALHALLGRFADEAVVVRSDLSGRPSYATVLQRVAARAAAAAAAGAPPGETGAACQAMFELHEPWWHTLDVDTSGAGVTAEHVRLPPGPAKFDVHLALWEQPDGGLAGELRYSSDILDRSTAARMGRHFEMLARSAVVCPDDAPFATLRMLPDDELALVTVEWNRTAPAPPFPPPIRLEAMVGDAAGARPEAVAVEEAGGRALTYAELARRSADVAARLSGRGAGGRCRPGDVVALAFGREAEAVVVVLGVLAAGCVFLPIDVESTPPGAVQAMLADARPAALLAMDRWGVSSTACMHKAEGRGPCIELLVATERGSAQGHIITLTSCNPQPMTDKKPGVCAQVC